MRINNSAKPQRRDPSRKQDESIDITLDPPQISPDSPLNCFNYILFSKNIINTKNVKFLYEEQFQLKSNIYDVLTFPHFGVLFKNSRPHFSFFFPGKIDPNIIIQKQRNPARGRREGLQANQSGQNMKYNKTNHLFFMVVCCMWQVNQWS